MNSGFWGNGIAYYYCYLPWRCDVLLPFYEYDDVAGQLINTINNK